MYKSTWGAIGKDNHMGSSLHVAFSKVWYDIFSPHRCSRAWLLTILGGIWVVVAGSRWPTMVAIIFGCV